MSKPQMHVAVVGSPAHGKSTFTAALSLAAAQQWDAKGPRSYALGRPIPANITEQGADTRSFSFAATAYNELVFGGDFLTSEHVRTITPALAPIETKLRIYCLNDCPAPARYKRGHAIGVHGAELAVLVVSAESSLEPQTTTALLLARAAGVRRVLVAITKIDLQPDPELCAVTEYEARELLASCGFDGNEAPVFFCNGRAALQGESAALEAFHRILDALDELPTERPRPVELPFRSVAARMFFRPRSPSPKRPTGYAFEAVLERGRLRTSDPLHWMHGGALGRTRALYLEVLGEKREEVYAGELALVVLENVYPRAAHGAKLSTGSTSKGPKDFTKVWEFNREALDLYRGDLLQAPGPCAQTTGFSARFERCIPRKFPRATGVGSVLLVGAQTTFVPAKVLEGSEEIDVELGAQGRLFLGLQWPRSLEPGQRLPAYATGELVGLLEVESVTASFEREYSAG